MLERLGLLPAQASNHAPSVDLFYFFLTAVSGFFAILIAVLVVAFAVKYRRRSEIDEPTPIHGSMKLEITWSAIPFGLAMIMFVWGASIFVTIKRPPDDALQIFVVGKQWMWKLQHLEGRREINELHVPIGRPIKLTLTSEDVIHSFYVPAFRIKQDAIPGRYTTMWFEATRLGTYHLFCAEYCGTEHSRMIGRVVVMEPAAYQEWLTGGSGVATNGSGTAIAAETGSGAAPSVADAGAALFGRLGCGTCHADTASALGPALSGLYGTSVRLQDGTTVTVDESYLRESILDPQARLVAGYQPLMPTFKGQVSEEELLQLITYIKSLGS